MLIHSNLVGVTSCKELCAMATLGQILLENGSCLTSSVVSLSPSRSINFTKPLIFPSEGNPHSICMAVIHDPHIGDVVCIVHRSMSEYHDGNMCFDHPLIAVLVLLKLPLGLEHVHLHCLSIASSGCQE